MKWMDNDKVVEVVLILSLCFMAFQVVRAFLHWVLG